MGAVVAVLTAAITTAGCQTASDQQPSTGGPPPANYRAVAADHLRKSLFDPYSVRDAQIAAPKQAAGPSLNSDGFYTPWVICVRANAKNRFGAYTGPQHTALAVKGGQVVNSWDEAHHSASLCGD